VCLIPGTSSYAIVHINSDKEAWLHTNWHERYLKLQLKCGETKKFSFLPGIEASRDSLAIFLDLLPHYELKLEDLPNEYNDAFELKPSSSNSKDAFYLSNKGLHFNDATLGLSPEETKNILEDFKLPEILLDEPYFLTLSTSFMVYLGISNNVVLLFSATKDGIKDSITKSSFLLPAHMRVFCGPSYPVVCWGDLKDDMEKIYLFVVSPNFDLSQLNATLDEQLTALKKGGNGQVNSWGGYLNYILAAVIFFIIIAMGFGLNAHMSPSNPISHFPKGGIVSRKKSQVKKKTTKATNSRKASKKALEHSKKD